LTASKIEWTDTTWNPVTGCTKISAGCKNCYAERMAHRLQCMENVRYRNGFCLTLHPDLISKPLNWKKPRFVFVNSMSDLFHEDVPIQFIKEVFHTMSLANHHIFQILTKRSKRLEEISSKLEWSSNIWMGVSVENQNVVNRISNLRKVPANVRFISCEPLIGPINDLPLSGIHWVIVGGESGPKSRPMERDWVTSIHEDCIKYQVPFFFKQWGGVQKKKNGRILNNQTYSELPTTRMNQEFDYALT